MKCSHLIDETFASVYAKEKQNKTQKMDEMDRTT